MNIKQVNKLFNELNTQEVRTLELRVGQVVRGVVAQQLPNQEALVNINGIQIKAKLEVPILEGQATLMQVAPDSKGGFIHLRQVDPASIGLQDPMKDILKSMQLPDKDWSNQLVRELRQEGFPLNKDTLQALAQAARLAPSNVDLEGWMQAATLAFKRGMPMTLASISAMHQISQGQPLHQLVSQLQQQLTQLLQTQGQSLSAQSTPLLQQLSNSLNQMLQTQVTQSNGSQATVQSIQTQQGQSNNPLQSNTPANMLNAPLQGQSNSTVNAQAIQTQLSSGGTQAINVAQNPLASFMKILGVQYENQLGQQVMQRGEVISNQGQTSLSNPTLQGQQNQLNNTNPNVQVQSGAVNQAQQSIIQASPIQQTVNGQQQALQATSNTSVQQAQQVVSAQTTGQLQSTQAANQAIQGNQINQELSTTQNTNLTNQQLTASQQNTGQQVNTNSQQLLGQQQLTHQQLDPHLMNLQSNQANVTQATDSIKATVMQALQLAEIPAPVKESLSQLLNHITGQQMMLSTERNHSMFTHITMYIPIKDENGGQTAAVHVQTRRDRKGQLDAENCRIVFDLNMKQLGQTLVDMNVVNKIVSLNIWNDASYIQPLIDAMRPEIVDSMQKTGYSLSSIKATPFKRDDDQQQLDEVKAIVQPPDVQHLNATRYKGVDLKV